MADEDQLRNTLSEINGIPFVERNGIYWGAPGSAEEAIEEIQRQLQRGVKFFIIAWPMFWMLKLYPVFSNYLNERFELRHESEAAQIFEFPKNAD